MKKKIIISVLLLLVLVIGTLISININNSQYVLKAYLKENGSEYTLVLKNNSYIFKNNIWKVKKIDESQEHISLMPWSTDEKSKKITKVVIEDNIKLDSLLILFAGLENLKEIDGLDKIDTTDVESMAGMFYNCKSLEKIDISSFNTSKLKNTSSMFNGCENLTTIYVNDTWNLDKVEYSDNMFKDCFKIEGQDGTVYDEDIIDKEYAVIDEGLNIGYLSKKGFFKEVEEENGEYIEQGTLTDEDFENVD